MRSFFLPMLCVPSGPPLPPAPPRPSLCVEPAPDPSVRRSMSCPPRAGPWALVPPVLLSFSCAPTLHSVVLSCVSSTPVFSRLRKKGPIFVRSSCKSNERLTCERASLERTGDSASCHWDFSPPSANGEWVCRTAGGARPCDPTTCAMTCICPSPALQSAPLT